MPLVTPGPAVERDDADAARDLGPRLRRERRALLVARVDDADLLLDAAVVEREQMTAVQREQHVDVVRTQGPRAGHSGVHGGFTHGLLPCASTSARNAVTTSSQASGCSNCGWWPASPITASRLPGTASAMASEPS